MKKVINFTSVGAYLNWILSEYKQLLSRQEPISLLKVIQRKTCQKTGETVFTVQFTGKNICPEFNARELVDDKILANFSKQDIRLIIEAAKNDEFLERPKDEATISAITLNHGARIYTVNTGTETSLARQYTANEIRKNKILVQQLNKENIADIAYQAGRETGL